MFLSCPVISAHKVAGQEVNCIIDTKISLKIKLAQQKMHWTLMSGIGWTDFSSEDRVKVQEVLNRLQEPDTLDELGIGQVGDAFSDLLFSDFATIQIRTRYFLAIPKIMLDRSAKSAANQLLSALITRCSQPSTF
jgi:hypothetical protein